MANVFPSARPYHLFFEHRPDYLYAYVESEIVNFDIARGFWVEVLSMVHRRKYKRVFVEKNITQRLAPHDTLTLVTELAHSSCRSIKFAIFDHHYDEEKCEFEEMIATNRGLTLKISNDLSSLERWLLNQPTFERRNKEEFPLKAGHKMVFTAR